MTTVVPPPSSPPVSAPPAPLPTAVVADPPPALARLPIGTLIEANVLAGQTRGMFRVNIPQGSFVMQTSAPLPKSATLVLQLVSLGSSAHLQIISINGKLSQQALRQPHILNPTKSQKTGSGLTSSPAVGGRAVGGGASVATASPFATLRTGATLTATLLKTPTVPGSPATSATSGTIGKPGPIGLNSKLNVASPTVVKGANKALFGAKATIPGIGKAGLATTPAAPSVNQPVKGKGASQATHLPITKRAVGVLPVGSQMKVKVLSLNLASPSAKVTAVAFPSLRGSGPVPTGSGNNLVGTVTGKTSSGQPILKTSIGALTLATRTPVPVGSTMTLEITSELTAPRHYSASAPTSREVMLQSRTWPELEEAIRVLAETNPAIAQQLTNNVIAQPNVKLAANMMFFMSALVGGNITSWIGDGAMRAIQRSRPDLAEKLKGDFKSLEKMAKEPARGDWRLSLIPIYAGGGIEQIRVMTRRLGDDDAEGNDEAEGTRFVVDVDLSQLGRLQLDGLVQNKGKRLDLIVRSGSVLSADMRDDIRGIFRQAGDVANISGGVTFQAGAADFVELSPEETERLGLIV